MFIWKFLSKVQRQGVAKLLLDFLPISCLVLLMKVLLIKESVYYVNFWEEKHFSFYLHQAIVKVIWWIFNLFENAFIYKRFTPYKSLEKKFFWKNDVIYVNVALLEINIFLRNFIGPAKWMSYVYPYVWMSYVIPSLRLSVCLFVYLSFCLKFFPNLLIFARS